MGEVNRMYTSSKHHPIISVWFRSSLDGSMVVLYASLTMPVTSQEWFLYRLPLHMHQNLSTITYLGREGEREGGKERGREGRRDGRGRERMGGEGRKEVRVKCKSGNEVTIHFLSREHLYIL